jgi:hypothetical protein
MHHQRPNTDQPEISESAFDGLMSEAAVLKCWPALSKARLRVARGVGQIAWVKGKRGSAWYRPTAIETFITKELEQPCRVPEQSHSSSSAINGSPESQDRKNSIVSGLSQELAERVAKASLQKIFAKQK